MRRQELIAALAADEPEQRAALFARARAVKIARFGNAVYLRGIIEFSNICRKNCFYCGIRRGNKQVRRYALSAAEIIQAADFAEQSGYGSIVLQAGERASAAYVCGITRLIARLKQRSAGRLGITLSLGEQRRDTLQRWFDAGAHRYLLRIETANPGLYRRLHPVDHDYDRRRECLVVARRIGYQVGTGVMIGLPYQTDADLADDILFFKNEDVDMIGMGPYIVHPRTPLAGKDNYDPRRNFRRALAMIALTRLCLPDSNIAATTALQALDPQGREKGLLAGANIIMPNMTPPRYRPEYQLYAGKPCLEESAAECAACLDQRVRSIGDEIQYNAWGDAPRFFARRR